MSVVKRLFKAGADLNRGALCAKINQLPVTTEKFSASELKFFQKK